MGKSSLEKVIIIIFCIICIIAVIILKYQNSKSEKAKEKNSQEISLYLDEQQLENIDTSLYDENAQDQ